MCALVTNYPYLKTADMIFNVGAAHENMPYDSLAVFPVARKRVSVLLPYVGLETPVQYTESSPLKPHTDQGETLFAIADCSDEFMRRLQMEQGAHLSVLVSYNALPTLAQNNLTMTRPMVGEGSVSVAQVHLWPNPIGEDNYIWTSIETLVYQAKQANWNVFQFERGVAVVKNV